MNTIELGKPTPAQPGTSFSPEVPLPLVTAYLPPNESPKTLTPLSPEQRDVTIHAMLETKHQAEFMQKVDTEAAKIEASPATPPMPKEPEPALSLQKAEQIAVSAAGVLAGAGPGMATAADVLHAAQNPPPAIVQQYEGSYDFSTPYKDKIKVPATATPTASMLPPTSREPIVSPPTPAPNMPGINDNGLKGGPIAAEPASPTLPPTGNTGDTKDLTPQQEHKDVLNIKNTPEPPKSPEKEEINLIIPDQIALQFSDIKTEEDLNKFKDKSGPVYKEITENPDYQNLLQRAQTFIGEYTTGKGLNAKDFTFSLTYKFADGRVHIGTIIYQLNNQQFAEAFYFLPQVDQPGPALKVGLPPEKIGYWTVTLAYDTSLQKQVAALTDAEGTFLSVINLPPEGVTAAPTPTPEPNKPTIEVASYIVTPEAHLQKQGTEKIVVEKINPPGTEVQNTLNLENYNGKPWEGKYAVKLDSKIIVNSDAHSLHGTITVDGKTYTIKSDGLWDFYQIKELPQYKINYLSLTSTVVGIIGTRYVTGGEVPGLTQPIQVIDVLSTYKDDSGKIHKIIYSIPYNNAHGQSFGENRPGRVLSTQELLDMLVSGKKIKATLTYPIDGSSWEEASLPSIKPNSPLADKIGVSLLKITEGQKQELLSFQNKPGPTYLGAPYSFSIN